MDKDLPKTQTQTAVRLRPAGLDDLDAQHAPEPGMQVTERVKLVRPLDSGGMGLVWLAEHLTLGTGVAVKFVQSITNHRLVKRLSREAQLAAKIDHPHAVRVFDHGFTRIGTPFIVMELLEGETLAQRIQRTGALSLEEVRALVSQVSDVLAEAHRLGIAHRDIKSHNIMLLSATKTLFAKVLDFGVAKRVELDEVTSTLTEEGELFGTPAYMAPEQLVDGTPADLTSDLWGTSVVAYEALTGKRPFLGRTRAALGAAMMLGRLAPPSTVNPKLPAALDEWFAANLGLDSNRRASSAKELAQSFEQAALGPVQDTERKPRLAKRLLFPDRLYGRDAELDVLQAALEQASSGRSRLVVIAGYSGIGKTALVAHAEKGFAQHNATFVGGKFDAFDRGTPYASLIDGFRRLIRRICTRETHEAWREAIIEGVGESLGVLTVVIPELESLVGEQPEPEPALPGEAKNRFRHAIGRFVRALASAERPLVVFLDDLQWADLPTFELIASLTSHPDSHHVLIIGTYRDNEVDAAHPLPAMLEKLRQSNAGVDEIRLGPLSEDAVLDLVADATEQAPGRVRLALACHAKTRGNAFFLRRFLEHLTESELVCFDHAQGIWTWDLAAISELPMAESVVDFVADQIRQMPSTQRHALGVAACIGSRFDLGALAFALEVDRGSAFSSLRHALASELIMPYSEGTWLTASADLRDDRMTFRFAHDRIRQAARLLVAEEDAAVIHRRVGRFLLEHLAPVQREQRLFELVEHLNRGGELEAQRRDQLVKLNLSAARRASASAAFDAADGYYQEALTRLDEGAWSRDYETALALHVEGARGAYLSGDQDRMEALVQAAIEHSEGLLDRVAAEEVQIQALASQNRFGEAIALARRVLTELSVELPLSPSTEDVGAAIGASLEAIASCGPDHVVSLPMASDPHVVAALRIQQGIMSSAYLAAPELVPILTSNIVRATIEHGVGRESCYGFAVLALVLNSANKLAVAEGVGEIAMGLLQRVDDRRIRPSTLHVITCYVRSWTRPLRESLEGERRVFQIGMDAGDLEYASWGLHMGMLNAYCAGVSLEELARSAERDISILRYHQQMPALSCSLPIAGAVARLRDEEHDFDERGFLAELQASGFRGGVCVTASVGAYERWVMRELDAAIELARLGQEYADGATATYNSVLWNQTLALATLAKKPTGSGGDAVSSIAPQLEQLRIWRSSSEHNHAHRVVLVEAEIARVEGRIDDALEAYDQAIELARQHQFSSDEAVAQELAARLYLERGKNTPARAYLNEALAAFERWSAARKCAALRAELGELIR